MSNDTFTAAVAGFTLGFGFLTVWEAIKQTVRNNDPIRSVYIYMIWGEILSNIGIGVMGWLLLNGVITATVPVLFFFLIFYVFEVQLLMQIIVNRIAIIAETQEIVKRVKWTTAVVITTINIAVFCIWIPAHREPPVSRLYVERRSSHGLSRQSACLLMILLTWYNVNSYVDINRVWDRISKSLICIVDALLNWFFLRNVKVRLVQEAGLLKYQPLVTFNTRLMAVSVLLDVSSPLIDLLGPK